MKLVSLKIENFRSVNFEHDFSDDQFIVLTGINGSGKSTIIEVLDLLLTKQANQIQQPFAAQVTNSVANFEVTVKADDNEIEYLADRIYTSQPNQADTRQIFQALKSNLFNNKNSYTRRIEVDRPVLGWSTQGNSIREFINDILLDRQAGFDSLIHPASFNIFAQEIALKFEQLEGLSLQFSNYGSKQYSIRNIFQPNNVNEQMRTSRTTVTASPLLDSLINYSGIDRSKVDELLADYNKILEPVKLEVGQETSGFTNIVMKRNDNVAPFTVDSASSGQKKAIVLATLKYTWKDSALKPIVLLDEPENSMHPGLTSKIFTSLNELVESVEAEPSFIIATHSPEVVAAMPNNTYRIIVEDGNSKLEKISGLESRAKILSELGVHFHLDYVAQKIVFVESVRDRTSGELSDESVYQRLIDSQKEEVLFISVGSRNQAEEKYKFQQQLFKKLKASSPGLVHRLKDRDDEIYDPTCHTPFRHIEYLYIISQKLLANSLSEALRKNITEAEIGRFMSKKEITDLFTAEKYKDIWKKLIAHYRLRGKIKGAVQGKIIDSFNKYPENQTKEIEQLFSRYRTASRR